MTVNRRAVLRGAMSGGALLAGAAPLLPGRARAQDAANTIRIGALTDMSGPYRDIEGPTGTACARQAAAEFAANNPGIRVEFVVADHQNKADVANTIVRQWFDQGGVDAIVQVGNTAVALAANTVAKEKDKVHLNSGALSVSLTGQYCSPNLVHAPLDTWSLSHSTVTSLQGQGAESWYFVTADYAYGHNLQNDATSFINKAGGKVLGSARYPFPGTTDFSSFLIQAQSSGAKVIALANSGTDVVNCIKQAREFGIGRRNTRIASLGGFLQDIAAVDLNAAQGLVLTEDFYWDLNDRTRAFYNRLKPNLPAGVFPSSLHAGAYGLMMQYLKAVKEVGVPAAKKSGRAVVEVMKRMPTDDDAFGPGRIREDGKMMAPNYLFQVKAPNESRGPGDLYKLVHTTPTDEAFRPLNEGGCPMLRG